MREQNSKNYLVFGLSGAGKSTFAAALWHLVDSHEIQTVLAKGLHSGNFRYLEKIAKRWCDGWRLERTKSEEVEDVRISLLHQETEAEFSLDFRDIAGESLETAFATRYCDSEFVELVKRSDGMLLFVSANRTMDDVTILDVQAHMGDDAREDDDDDEGDDEDDVEGAASAQESRRDDTEDQPFDPATRRRVRRPASRTVWRRSERSSHRGPSRCRGRWRKAAWPRNAGCSCPAG
jgi:hypothetical protein